MALNFRKANYDGELCVRGYHVYQRIWTAAVGEVLHCEREPTNSRDRYAVAVKKFRALNFRKPGHLRKYCNNENFPIYGILYWTKKVLTLEKMLKYRLVKSTNFYSIITVAACGKKQGWPNAAARAACGPQRVFNVLQLCVAYIAVAHYKIRLIKKWPSRTELLANPEEDLAVAIIDVLRYYGLTIMDMRWRLLTLGAL